MAKHQSCSPAAPPVEWLSVQVVAQRLDISVMQVYRLLGSGRLMGYNFGDGKRRALWKIKPADLEAFILASCNDSLK